MRIRRPPVGARWGRWALPGAIAGTVLLGVVASAQAGFPGRPGRIVFSSTFAGNRQAFVAAPDGSGRSRSLVDSAAQGPPRLVFSSDRGVDYNPEVYSLDVAGGVRRDISRSDGFDQVVALRGEQVVFVSDRSGVALYVAQLRSRKPARRLFALPGDAEVASVSASWSPTGEELAVAFLRERRQEQVIDLIDRAGRTLAQLHDARPVTGSSMWSADGRLLAYLPAPFSPAHEVVRFADARGRLQFTQHGFEVLWAQASPRFALNSSRIDVVGIPSRSVFVDDEQGRVIRRFAGVGLDLSPDGASLVLWRSPKASWLASVDTGRLRRVPAGDGRAAFSPDGKHLELQPANGKTAIMNVSSGRIEGHLAAFGQWLSDSNHLLIYGPARIDATIVTSTGRVLHRLKLGPQSEADTVFTGTPLATQDGTALVYAIQSDHVHQLYEQLPSGRLLQITRGTRDHTQPASSPDGRLIADSEFQTPCGNCNPFLLGVLAADGSGPVPLMQVPGENQYHPTWSPDGTHIAYAINEPSGAGITVVQADGSQPTALAGGVGATEPTWSPDGSAIAATHNGIFIMASDGTNAHQLTAAVPEGSNADQTVSPTWSPDSATLAFAGADGLYLIGRNGTDLHRILAIQHAGSLAWSPDGTLIAFAVPACQNCSNANLHDIWTVRPDGSDLNSVISSLADDTTPTWLPQP